MTTLITVLSILAVLAIAVARAIGNYNRDKWVKHRQEGRTERLRIRRESRWRFWRRNKIKKGNGNVNESGE